MADVGTDERQVPGWAGRLGRGVVDRLPELGSTIVAGMLLLASFPPFFAGSPPRLRELHRLPARAPERPVRLADGLACRGVHL